MPKKKPIKLKFLALNQKWAYKGKLKTMPKVVKTILHVPTQKLALCTVDPAEYDDWVGQVHASFLITKHPDDWELVR